MIKTTKLLGIVIALIGVIPLYIIRTKLADVVEPTPITMLAYMLFSSLFFFITGTAIIMTAEIEALKKKLRDLEPK